MYLIYSIIINILITIRKYILQLNVKYFYRRLILSLEWNTFTFNIPIPVWDEFTTKPLREALILTEVKSPFPLGESLPRKAGDLGRGKSSP